MLLQVPSSPRGEPSVAGRLPAATTALVFLAKGAKMSNEAVMPKQPVLLLVSQVPVQPGEAGELAAGKPFQGWTLQGAKHVASSRRAGLPQLQPSVGGKR